MRTFIVLSRVHSFRQSQYEFVHVCLHSMHLFTCLFLRGFIRSRNGNLQVMDGSMFLRTSRSTQVLKGGCLRIATQLKCLSRALTRVDNQSISLT